MGLTSLTGRTRAKSKAGDRVRVRSREEILATLDAQGMRDGLPFMPEMLAFCGREMRVFRRAHKSCDTIHKTGNRRMRGAVHLEEARCDGSAHGGCGAACLLFWKEEWLEPVATGSGARGASAGAALCTEASLAAATRRGPDSAAPYQCQATRLFDATSPLAWWDPRQYIEDVRSGNCTFSQLLGALSFRAFTNVLKSRWIRGYRLLLSAYNAWQRLRGGRPYPKIEGKLEKTPGPDEKIGAGDWVRVRSVSEIEATLNRRNRNRGMYFDAEMTPFCGQTFRVKGEVKKIIDERTGEMIALKDSWLLDGVHCLARYSDRRIACPRAILPYWRTCWLQRIEAPASVSPRIAPE